MGYIKLHKNEVCKFARYMLLLFLFIIHYFVLIIVRQMKKFHVMNITNYQKKNKKNTV